MYAEGWIYRAPAVAKTVEDCQGTEGQDTVQIKRGIWQQLGRATRCAMGRVTGGGSKLRIGCHPLATIPPLWQVKPEGCVAR